MVTKKEIIDLINTKNGTLLNSSNTSYSSINKSKEVWWFNVPVNKFNDTVHLLLNTNNKFIWICLPKGFVQNIPSKFKIREDKNAVDLEISSDRNFKYMIDVKSGGTGFDFTPFIKNGI